MGTVLDHKILRVWTLCLLLVAASGRAVESSKGEPQAHDQKTGESEILTDYTVALEPWTGDYDGMVARRMIRILVPYSMTHYFLDGVTERGVVAVAGRELEQEVNNREGLRTRLIRVVFIPIPRNQLIAKLLDGMGDIAVGSLTITASRQAAVDFSEPVYRNSQAILCTGPGSPAIEALEDLAGQQVYVQASSIYYESVQALSKTFQQQGLPQIQIETLDEWLEPDEILELVQAGVIPLTVMDRHFADFWGQVFSDLKVHSDIVVADGLDIGWAFRKNSPQLAEVVNAFVMAHRHRTKFGNIVFRRYLENVRWVNNPDASADWARYEQTKPLFQQFASQYDLDPLMLMALGYQESRLDQRVRSPVGAIGVMQLMPATGASLAVGDITQIEPNIHGGSRYLQQLLDLFEGPGVDRLNQTLFALAAYNGGQTRIRRLRRETAEKGLDPNLWFDNVELLSARVIGRENVQYVRNIYKYHLAFRLIEKRRAERADRAGQ